MSLASDFDDLAAQSVDFRNELFGRDQAKAQQMFTSDGMSAPLPCYFTARGGQILDPAMMLNVNDGVVRIRKSAAAAATPAFVPRLGQIIKLLNANDDGSALTIELGERLDSAWNPEFVLKVENIIK